MLLNCHPVGLWDLQPDAVPVVQQRGGQTQGGDVLVALPAAAAPQRTRLARISAARWRGQRGGLSTRRCGLSSTFNIEVFSMYFCDISLNSK